VFSEGAGSAPLANPDVEKSVPPCLFPLAAAAAVTAAAAARAAPASESKSAEMRERDAPHRDAAHTALVAIHIVHACLPPISFCSRPSLHDRSNNQSPCVRRNLRRGPAHQAAFILIRRPGDHSPSRSLSPLHARRAVRDPLSRCAKNFKYS